MNITRYYRLFGRGQGEAFRVIHGQPLTAGKDDAPAADQAAINNVAGQFALSGEGGLIQTTAD